MKIPKRASLIASLKCTALLRTTSAPKRGAALLLASFAVSIVLHSLVLLVPAHGLKQKNEATAPGVMRNTVIDAGFIYRKAGQATMETSNDEQKMESKTNTAAFEPNVENATKPAPLPAPPQPKASPPAKSDIALSPEFEQDFDAKYPFMALSKGIRGSVRASFRLGKDGAIEDIIIIDSTPSGVFDTAVMLALTNARIKPESVQKNGRLTVTVVFDPSGTNPQESLSQQ